MNKYMYKDRFNDNNLRSICKKCHTKNVVQKQALKYMSKKDFTKKWDESHQKVKTEINKNRFLEECSS